MRKERRVFKYPITWRYIKKPWKIKMQKRPCPLFNDVEKHPSWDWGRGSPSLGDPLSVRLPRPLGVADPCRRPRPLGTESPGRRVTRMEDAPASVWCPRGVGPRAKGGAPRPPARGECAGSRGSGQRLLAEAVLRLRPQDAARTVQVSPARCRCAAPSCIPQPGGERADVLGMPRGGPGKGGCPGRCPPPHSNPPGEAQEGI